MTNIRREVERIIEHDAVIKKGLRRDIINIRGLAKFIQKKISQNASLDAIISAIRRYPLKEESIRFSKIEWLMKNCKLSLKNKIADIALVNDTEIHEIFGKIPPLIKFNTGEIFRLIVAVQSIKLIADEKNLDKILNQFPEDKIIKIIKNLSEIIVTFPKEAEGTPGILSNISTELALNDINIVEIMSSIPELILIVDEKDASKCYECLSNFFLK